MHHFVPDDGIVVEHIYSGCSGGVYIFFVLFNLDLFNLCIAWVINMSTELKKMV